MRRPSLRTTWLAALAALGGAAPAARTEEIRAVVWHRLEIPFTAQGTYEKPGAQVELAAVFKGPDGASFRVNGFWDGGAAWKIRFAPTAPGPWTYETACNVADAGLAGRKGAFSAQPAAEAAANPLRRHGGILRVSADHRYLTYSDGTPFFWLGDTWWFCPSDLVPFDGSTKPGCASMYKALVDRRRDQGFTVVQMAFLGDLGKSQGVNSFRSLLKDRTIDVAYWRQVDRYLDCANDAGLVPVIGMAFHVGIDANPLDDWQFLWRYVVARYGAHAVTWLICGEYNQNGGDQAGRVTKTMALGAFIKEQDPYKRAMTVHPWWHGGDKRQAWEQPWYDFIMFQGAHAGHGNVPPTALYRDAWNRQPARPVLEAECNYEGIYAGKPGREHTPDDVRRVAYHAIQAGSFGYTYGAQGLWYPTQNAEDKTFSDWGTPMVWWESLERPGAAQMGFLRKCYESVAWWKLAPRPDAVEFQGKVKDATRPLAKSEGDAAHLVWFPKGSGAQTAAALSLADPAAAGAYAATWFNPRDGQETKQSAPLAAAGGKCPLPARPDEEDWMLILKRAP
jgi:hypothetical protein